MKNDNNVRILRAGELLVHPDGTAYRYDKENRRLVPVPYLGGTPTAQLGTGNTDPTNNGG